jgi:plastocyanin
MQNLSKLVAISLVSLAAACGGSSSGSTAPINTGPGTPSTPATPVVTTAVSVGDDFFDPANIQVSPGANVTWTFPTGIQTHNVTFSDAASGDKSPGSSFTKAFPTAGTFTYNCTLHPGMNGSVLVK